MIGKKISDISPFSNNINRVFIEPKKISKNKYPYYDDDVDLYHSPYKIFNDPRSVPSRDDKKKITFVLDLDETLITTKDKYIYVRPYVSEFLSSIHHHYSETVELVLWSAGVYSHVQRGLEIIDPDDLFFDYKICRGNWHVKEGGYKILNKLRGREEDTLFLIDNTPTCGLGNNLYQNIIVPNFVINYQDDTTLLYIIQIIFLISDKAMIDDETTAVDFSSLILNHPFLEKEKGPGGNVYLLNKITNQVSLFEKIKKWDEIYNND